jgi:ketosteroid isomerase-like protein
MNTPEDEAEIAAANEAFYAAFRARDQAAMEALWSRRADIACVHPGWTPLWGRDAVLGSWARILSNPANPQIHARGVKVIAMGDAAYVLCLEVAAEGTMAATNVFVREEGHWRMVGHHAGAIAMASEPETPSPRRRGPLH